jgi:hypothetical protein
MAALLTGLFACENSSEAARERAPWAAAPADTEWVTVDGVEFPAGMEDAEPEILEAYLFAAKHPEVLQYMPCYCGCENAPSNHESNYDCFVDGIDHSSDVPRVSPDAMGFS